MQPRMFYKQQEAYSSRASYTLHHSFKDAHPVQYEEWPGTTLQSARKRKQSSRNTAIFFFAVALQISINEEAGLFKILSFLQVKIKEYFRLVENNLITGLSS